MNLFLIPTSLRLMLLLFFILIINSLYAQPNIIRQFNKLAQQDSALWDYVLTRKNGERCVKNKALKTFLKTDIHIENNSLEFREWGTDNGLSTVHVFALPSPAHKALWGVIKWSYSDLEIESTLRVWSWDGEQWYEISRQVMPSHHRIELLDANECGTATRQSADEIPTRYLYNVDKQLLIYKAEPTLAAQMCEYRRHEGNYGAEVLLCDALRCVHFSEVEFRFDAATCRFVR